QDRSAVKKNFVQNMHRPSSAKIEFIRRNILLAYCKGNPNGKSPECIASSIQDRIQVIRKRWIFSDISFDAQTLRYIMANPNPHRKVSGRSTHRSFRQNIRRKGSYIIMDYANTAIKIR